MLDRIDIRIQRRGIKREANRKIKAVQAAIVRAMLVTMDGGEEEHVDRQFIRRKVYPRVSSVYATECVECGDPLPGMKYEAGNKYAVCDSVCGVIVHDRETVAQWLAGKSEGGTGVKIWPSVRRYLLDEAGHKCQLCGWGIVHPVHGGVPVNIDHRDGNSTNHRRSNLIVLCPNCHSLTPTYGGLNRGAGRAVRLKNQATKVLRAADKRAKLAFGTMLITG